FTAIVVTLVACNGRPSATGSPPKTAQARAATAPSPRPLTPEPRFAVLRRDQAATEQSLKTARASLEGVRSSLASNVDPPVVRKMIEDNARLQQYRAAADSQQQQYEALSSMLGPNHPRVQAAVVAKDTAIDKART